MQITDKNAIRGLIDSCLKAAPCDVEIKSDEPMSQHTTFKVGGKADFWVCPKGEGFVLFSSMLLYRAKKEGIPVFILGGGANIVVSDNGIRGIVLDTTAWKGQTTTGEDLVIKSGTSMDEAADCAAEMCFSGLEFLAGMPGTIGGAVYMNARCYGSEISDVLKCAVAIDYTQDPEEELETFRVPANKEQFGYKKSPFQINPFFILSAVFKLQHGEKEEILAKMEKYRNDRKEKGHYLFPCAGSAFKNNHDFGKPTGQIIDELGLKGFSIGGAQVAPFHGNIFINKGGATASDIRALVKEVSDKVKAKTGFILEPEILFVGE
jgi:UDP-N-acetylmuramate dehydrogenase